MFSLMKNSQKGEITMANFSEWKIEDAKILLVKNNTNGLYMFKIWTKTGHKIELDLEDPETRIYQSGNFFALTKISQKQSEVGVQFKPKETIKDCECPLCKICSNTPIIPKDHTYLWVCIRCRNQCIPIFQAQYGSESNSSIG